MNQQELPEREQEILRNLFKGVEMEEYKSANLDIADMVRGLHENLKFNEASRTCGNVEKYIVLNDGSTAQICVNVSVCAPDAEELHEEEGEEEEEEQA